MFDQSHGLRFDIYERIHLSEELPGIAELEEVELIPEIQVIQREDRAELYGQLLLTGLYRGENDRTERLEHAIPVEITVPLTRVSSLEDIGVEIDNFDIDLLTMRTVNITGVLSLRGIGGAEPQPAWQQEEYTAAYSPSQDGQSSDADALSREHVNDALYENSLWTYGEGTAESLAEEHESVLPVQEAAGNPLFLEGSVFTHQPSPPSAAQQKDKEVKLRTHSLDTQSGYAGSGSAEHWNKTEQGKAESVSSHFFGAQEKTENSYPANPTDTAYPGIDANAVHSAEFATVSGTESTGGALSAADAAAAVDQAEGAEIHAVQSEATPLTAEAGEELVLITQDSNESFTPQEIAEEGIVSQETVPVPEEKPDLKVALGSKKETENPAKEHLTFSSLLSSSRARKEQESLLTEEAVAVPAAPEVVKEGEWKSRFIGGLGGAELFRKVRLCIVQREETLDTIAEKYQLSARELVMYNRLSGQNVEEGQVLYIP